MTTSPDQIRAEAEAFAAALPDSEQRPLTKDGWIALIGKLHSRKWLGPDFETFAQAGAVLEGLSLGGTNLGVPMVLTVNYLMALRALARYAPEALAPLKKGEGLACMAASEPKVGSHPKKIQTTARKDGSEWVLNGQKVFTTGGPMASVALVLAVCGESEAGRDLVLFAVPTTAPGFTMNVMPTHPGLECAPHGAPTLKEVRVPLSARIGGEGPTENGWTRIVKPFRQWEDALLQSWVAGIAARAAKELASGAIDESRAPLGRLVAGTRALQTLARDSAKSLDEEEEAGLPASGIKDLIARRYGFYEHLRGMMGLVDEVQRVLAGSQPPALLRLRMLMSQTQFAANSRTKIVEGLAG